MHFAVQKMKQGTPLKTCLILLAAALACVASGCGAAEQTPGTSPPTVTRTTTVIERTVPAAPSEPRRAFASCGGYVEALAGTTSCDFANNVFWEFFQAQPERDFPAYSSVTGKNYEIHCAGTSIVTCTGGTGAKIRFPLTAVAAYTQRDAAAYATSHDLGPDAAESAAQSRGDSAPVTVPDSASFCSTHACIDSFDSGSGYIVQCEDGEWSHSGGRPGACSYHGGETGRTYP